MSYGLRLLALLCAVSSAHGQIISTLAGTSWTFPATPIPALKAPLGETRALALDSAGNLYVSDFQNSRVMQIAPDGSLTVVAGNGIAGYSGDGGPATYAALWVPFGLAVDNSGNLYIADFANCRVRKVSRSGIITTVAGTGDCSTSGDGGPAVNAGVASPEGIAVDGSGNLFVATDDAIRKITPAGTISTVAPNGNGTLTPDTGLAVDSAGNLYIAGGGRGVRKLTPAGVLTTVASDAAVHGANAVAPDGIGNLFLSDSNHRVRRLTPGGILSTVAGTGTAGFAGDGGPPISALLDSPIGVAFDAAGNLLIADAGNFRVRKIANGIISTVAGNGHYGFAGDGGPARSAVFGDQAPEFITRDLAGNLYVVDTNRVRKITPDGNINTVAGDGTIGFAGDGGPAVNAQFGYIRGIAVDAAGNMYIADNANHRIRKVTTDGIVTTIAGTGAASHSGDTGPALKAGIPYPQSVTVDSAGNLYICESYQVRKIDRSGTITTIAGNGTQGSAGDNGPAINAQLGSPAFLALDAAGIIYIADAERSQIRKITTDGIIHTFAGKPNINPYGDGFSGDNGPAISAQLAGPFEIAIDGAGNVFIADTNNQRIRKVNTAGFISTVAGTGDTDYTGDGGPAINAALNYPEGIVLDPAGNLYVADTANSRIRVILAGPPTIVVSPGQLTFSGAAGGAPAASQNLSVAASVAGIPFTATVSSAATSWLSLSTTSTQTPRLLDVIADPSNLAPGAYHGTITIAAPTATPASSSVDVSFTVAPGTDPVLSLDARNLSFAFARTGAPQAQKLTVSNSGAGKLTFTASASTVNGGAWLSVSPGSGLATPASPVTLGVTADPTGLPPGTYTGSVTINSVAVKVAMTVSSSNQAILLSQRGLTFTAVAGGGVIPPQTFSVLNIGAAPISWTVSTSTLAGGSNWLQASPGSGTTGLGTQSATPITVSVNPAGLPAGSYYGLVRIDAPGAANTPQVLTAFLQVLPAGSDVAPSVQPGALLFTAPAGGGSPGSATVLVYNIGATPKSFHTAASGGFVTLPTDATLNPQQPTPIVIQPFTTGLAPNVYSNTLTLQFSDGRVSRVNVKVIVTAAGSSSAASPRAPGCTPTKLLPALSTLADSFEVSAGWPVALGAVVRDDCGAPHSSGSVTVSFSNADPPVTLQSLADGRWEGTWPNRTTAGSKITLKIHAENPQLNIAGDQQVAGGLQSQQQPPIFDLAGITAVFNGPSYVPLAPGSVISIFGDRLAESATQSSGYPLPNQLVTTQIIMAGVKLPLYYVSQTQVNAVVPFALNPNAPQYLLVQRGLTYSLPALVNVAPAQPSLFPVITDYPATGGAPFPVTTANAAQSGDTLVLYCTGLGTVTPAVPDGSGPTGTSQTDNTVQLLIGGQSARVDYAGLAPGFAGLYQINAVVPSGVSSGNVPVAITVAGQTSPPVTIAVK